MADPNFRKMSRAELHKYKADLYTANPRHIAAATAELDRRDHRLRIITLIFAFISALYVVWQMFNYFFQPSLPFPTQKVIPYQKNTIENKTDTASSARSCAGDISANRRPS